MELVVEVDFVLVFGLEEVAFVVVFTLLVPFVVSLALATGVVALASVGTAETAAESLCVVSAVFVVVFAVLAEEIAFAAAWFSAVTEEDGLGALYLSVFKSIVVVPVP